MQYRISVFVLVLVALLAMAGCQPIQPVEAQSTSDDVPAIQLLRTHVATHPSQGDVVAVEGTDAHLFMAEEGATIVVNTRDLVPGNVYTAWLVVINNPSACAQTPCTGGEVIGSSDALDADVGYGDGLIAMEDGVGRFAAYLPVGEWNGSWFGNGFTNPQDAEIHVVVNDHGPLIPEMASTMINSYRGGCADESLPPPFPDTAKADGEPGPNTCRLLQAAIFTR